MNDIDKARRALMDIIDRVDANDNDLPEWATAIHLRSAALAYEAAWQRRLHRAQLALAACTADIDALDVDTPCAYFQRGKGEPCVGCPAYDASPVGSDEPCVKSVMRDMLSRVAEMLEA